MTVSDALSIVNLILIIIVIGILIFFIVFGLKGFAYLKQIIDKERPKLNNQINEGLDDLHTIKTESKNIVANVKYIRSQFG